MTLFLFFVLPSQKLNKIYPRPQKIQSIEVYWDVHDNDEMFQLHEKLLLWHDQESYL